MAWTCPNCSRSFANKNQWHSCGKYELSEHFHGKAPGIVALYHAIEQAVLACGECRVEPAKTAILFKRRVTFVAIKLRQKYVGIGIRLRREVLDERVHQTFQMGPGLFENRFRLSHLHELDDGLCALFCEAWADAE